MTAPGELPELRCAPGRVALFATAFVGSILGPLVVLFGLALFGPSPYVVDRDSLALRWIGSTTRIGDAEARVMQADDSARARSLAEEIEARIPISSATTLPGLFRYRRADTGRVGLILRDDDLVLQLEAPDREQLDEAVRQLPFIAANPQPHLLDHLLESPVTLAGGLVLYLFLAALLMARGASWAGTIAPADARDHASAGELRRRLLEVDGLDCPFTIREDRHGDLVAEWRLLDARWTSVFTRAGLRRTLQLRLRLGADRTVRAIESERGVSWSGGLGGILASWSWSRPIRFFHAEAGRAHGLLYREGGWRFDTAYAYRFDGAEVKTPIVRAIVDAGWSFRPVLTFLPPFG